MFCRLRWLFTILDVVEYAGDEFRFGAAPDYPRLIPPLDRWCLLGNCRDLLILCTGHGPKTDFPVDRRHNG